MPIIVHKIINDESIPDLNSEVRPMRNTHIYNTNHGHLFPNKYMCKQSDELHFRAKLHNCGELHFN